jgi:hypothetical protein
MKKTSILFAIPALCCLAANLTSAATIPAGATLVVRTLDTISSQDVPGTRFAAQLQNNVAVKGTVLLRAGTRLSGKIATSKRTHHNSYEKLTVDITEATVGGRAVPIKTTGAYHLDNTNFKTRNDRYVSRPSYHVAAGRLMEFRLAQPLTF